MPRPNEPEFYTPPSDKYPNVTHLLSGNCVPETEEEKAVYRLSYDNLYAFMKSRILYTTESPERIEQVFSQIPGYNPNDPLREERRQLSAAAREQILDLAMDYQIGGEGMKFEDRTLGLLMVYSRDPADQDYNEQVQEILDGGNPEEIGQLVDQRVENAVPMFKKILSGISDREVIEYFKIFQRCQNVVFNASNILKLADQKQPAIVISPQTRELLNFMEENSVLVDYLYQRIRAIANPTYEYMDMDALLQMNDDDFNTLQDQSNSNEIGIYDYLFAVFNLRMDTNLQRQQGKKAINDSLTEVNRANEGFFIGSRAYSQASRSLEKLAKLRNAIDEPPTAEQVERLKPMLRETIQKCQEYLDTKDPLKFKNQREEIRYNAMKRAMESCQMDLNFYDLQIKGERSEKLNFYRPNPDVEYPQFSNDDVETKIKLAYGTYTYENQLGEKFAVDSKLGASNVGDIADQLRENICNRLNEILLKNDEFDQELARNVMANMVALEMVKNGRSLDASGNIIAGPVEQALANNPLEVIDSVLDNRYFQVMTPDVSKEMIGNFLLSDGAKRIADQVEKIAQKNSVAAPEQEVPQVQNQMDRQMIQ